MNVIGFLSLSGFNMQESRLALSWRKRLTGYFNFKTRIKNGALIGKVGLA
jgi:hypothetical protein